MKYFIATFILLVTILSGCDTYKESFAKAHIPATEDLAGVIDMATVSIGTLPWIGKEWRRVYQEGDPSFRIGYPWDQDYPHENVIQDMLGVRLAVTPDTRGAVLYSNFTVKYAKIQVLAKLPNVDGVWSGIWLYNDLPELDIIEHCGQWKDMVTVTHHWGYEYEDGRKKMTHANERENKDFAPGDGYYWYEVDWTPYSVTYSINGVVTRVMTEGVPSQDMHIIFSIGYGDYCGSTGVTETGQLIIKEIKITQN